MYRLLPLVLLGACQADITLRDDFTNGTDPLFGRPSDHLAPAYLSGASFDIEVRGPDRRLDGFDLVSSDPTVFAVDAVTTQFDTDSGLPRRIAQVRAVGPGTAELAVQEDGRVRHAVSVVVGDPDRVDVQAVLHHLISQAYEGDPLPTALSRIDLLASGTAEVRLIPFSDNVPLSGSIEPTITADGVTIDRASYDSPENHEVYAVGPMDSGDSTLSVTYASGTFSVPITGHDTVDSLSLVPLACDETRSLFGECVVVALAETADGAPLLGGTASFATDGDLQWTASETGDLWSYVDEEAAMADLVLTATMDEVTATLPLSVPISPTDRPDDRFTVRHSNEVTSCAHSTPGTVWAGLVGLVLVAARRRKNATA